MFFARQARQAGCGGLRGSARAISITPPMVVADAARLPVAAPQDRPSGHLLTWATPPQNVLVVKKELDPRVLAHTVAIVKHLHTHYPLVNVMVLAHVAREIEAAVTLTPDYAPTTPQPVFASAEPEVLAARAEVMVLLGGDGTILHGVRMFQHHRAPPVVLFALGTLGFLLPFDVRHFGKVFGEVYGGTSRVLHRSRLRCAVTRADGTEEPLVLAMNDLVLHRGACPHLATFDVYIDGDFFTRTTGDGVVFSTPTGSTAYLLLAGGSIVHPSVPCILITPICPRLLSFRPVVVPASLEITLQVAQANRNEYIECLVDGARYGELRIGDRLHLKEATHDGVWCVARSAHDWGRSVNELLGFNEGFGGRGKR